MTSEIMLASTWASNFRPRLRRYAMSLSGSRSDTAGGDVARRGEEVQAVAQVDGLVVADEAVLSVAGLLEVEVDLRAKAGQLADLGASARRVVDLELLAVDVDDEVLLGLVRPE